MNNLIREAYKSRVPPEQIETGADVLLYANESPENIAPEILGKEDIADLLSIEFNRYPDCSAYELRKAYGVYLGGVPAENIAAGNGSDELIRVIGDVYLNAGDLVLSCEPAFSVYKRSAEIAKGRYIGIDSDDEFLTPNIDKLIATANGEKAKIVFICTPHNPTGYLWSEEQINRVLAETSCIVVADEAYIDFGGESMARKAVENERLIVLRTMSKAFALAGLRVGFAVGTKDNIRAINAGVDMYNINSFSQAVAVKILGKSAQIRTHVAHLINEREFLLDSLREFARIKVFPSSANFILIKTELASQIIDCAKMRNILLREYCDAKDLIRISVGLRAENERLLACIKEVIYENG